jgi:acyl-CoA dehydrogenase
MRLIGLSERMLELMCKRTLSRVAFGRPIADQGVTRERIAESRIAIDQCRLLTLKAAHMMDTVGNKAARAEIAMIKVAAPNMACKVIDWVMQAFGAAGTNNDVGVASAYATARMLRLADGPDEVHRNQIAKLEARQTRLGGHCHGKAQGSNRATRRQRGGDGGRRRGRRIDRCGAWSMRRFQE